MTTRTRLRASAVALTLALVSSACGAIPGTGGGGGMRVTAFFERTVSLFEGSQVRVLGLPAGTVDSVEVDGDLVKVELNIDEGVSIPADASATIVPFSLIGERFVQLFPAYTGGPRMEAGAVIPAERTSIPVEPDEALVSLRDFLDDLNPEGTSRLTKNLREDLEGQGQELNRALRRLADLAADFGSKSDTIGRIIDNLDDFTATLVTREAQIGAVLDDFASVTEVLAAERDHLGNIVTNLASFAGDAGQIVDEHVDRLDRDLEVLEHVAQAVSANLGAVEDLLDAGPITATGLKNAYDPENRVIMLRNDAELGDDGSEDAEAENGGQSANRPTRSDPAPPESETPTPESPDEPIPESPFTPIDRLLDELLDGEGEGGPLELSSRSTTSEPGGAERLARGIVDFFGGLGSLARDVVGVS